MFGFIGEYYLLRELLYHVIGRSSGFVVFLVIALVVYFRFGRRLHRKTIRNGRRDQERFFPSDVRSIVMSECDGRCEYPRVVLGRCSKPGTQIDHVFPWSKGGLTELPNASLLCEHHNKVKSNRWPSMFYLWRLSRQRKGYAQQLPVRPKRSLATSRRF